MAESWKDKVERAEYWQPAKVLDVLLEEAGRLKRKKDPELAAELRKKLNEKYGSDSRNSEFIEGFNLARSIDTKIKFSKIETIGEKEFAKPLNFSGDRFGIGGYLAVGQVLTKKENFKGTRLGLAMRLIPEYSENGGPLANLEGSPVTDHLSKEGYKTKGPVGVHIMQNYLAKHAPGNGGRIYVLTQDSQSGDSMLVGSEEGESFYLDFSSAEKICDGIKTNLTELLNMAGRRFFYEKTISGQMKGKR